MKRTFVDFEGQICIITGAGSTSGIGFETAKILGGHGGKIILTSTTGRIHERAAELAKEGIEAKGYVADLKMRALIPDEDMSAVLESLGKSKEDLQELIEQTKYINVYKGEDEEQVQWIFD